MKFPLFRKIKASPTQEELTRFVVTDLHYNFEQLDRGLVTLNFADNFRSFTEDIVIPATSELKITNRLGAIPTGRIIIKSNSSTIVDGDTEDTAEFVYLKNTGGTQATLRVVWFR